MPLLLTWKRKILLKQATLKAKRKKLRAEPAPPLHYPPKVSVGPKPSFVDTLKYPNSQAIYEGKMDLLNLNDNNYDIADYDNRYDVRMEKGIHEKLCKPRKEVLVVKLIGEKHSFEYLKSRLQQKWAPKGSWQLMNLENDYYLARFKNSDDRLFFFLTGGPWMIGGHYLAIQQWKTYLDPKEETIDAMAVWVRVANMLLELMYDKFLERVGNKMEKLLKNDINTVQHEKGRYARICVEIDLKKPLKTFIRFK